MNSDNDILEVGIQTILLVEDSVRFYSSVLPHLYKFLLKQSLIFSTEALNEHERCSVCADVQKSFWHAHTRRR